MTRLGKLLGGRWVGGVSVEPEPWAEPDMCHHNAAVMRAEHGGEVVRGYYILRFLDGHEFHAISHSVWRDRNGSLLDITPTHDSRPFNMFIETHSEPHPRARKSLLSLDKYGVNHEITMPFYVYLLVDPRSELPFYVGKGTGRRALTHLWNCSRTPNPFKENTIQSIRAAGHEPRVEYVAEDLADEAIAYELEAFLIRHYGRKGYDEGGILTNVCEDARPPSLRGKTYVEIRQPGTREGAGREASRDPSCTRGLWPQEAHC